MRCCRRRLRDDKSRSDQPLQIKVIAHPGRDVPLGPRPVCSPMLSVKFSSKSNAYLALLHVSMYM